MAINVLENSLYNKDMTLGRILQNAFEDPEVFEEEENCTFLFIIAPFFLLWNFMVGICASFGLCLLLRGKWGDSLAILICPHWLIGILVPTWFGYDCGGALACALTVSITIVLPYGVWFVYHARCHEELRGYPLCGCCVFPDSSSLPGIISETPGRVRHDENNEREIKVEGADETSSDGHPFLIFKKVLPAEAIGMSSNTKDNGDGDGNHSFRFNHPKSDIYARHALIGTENVYGGVDITDEKAIGEAMKKIKEAGIALDMIINNAISETPGRVRHDENNEREIKVEGAEETSSDGHPFLIFKKVLPAEAIGKSSNTKDNGDGDGDGNHSFRFKHPKSDIYARHALIGTENVYGGVDVTDEEAIGEAMKKIKEAGIALDMIINNPNSKRVPLCPPIPAIQHNGTNG